MTLSGFLFQCEMSMQQLRQTNWVWRKLYFVKVLVSGGEKSFDIFMLAACSEDIYIVKEAIDDEVEEFVDKDEAILTWFV